MPGFVVTSVFEVGGGKVPLGQDVLAQAWGMGHRFSYCDGRMLTLVVELTAIDRASAFEALLSRAEMVWQGLGHGSLGAPVTLRMHTAVEPESVPAGIAPAVAPEAPWQELRRKVARELRYVNPWERVADVLPRRKGPGDDPPDDGGLAGVREPRRPRPGPPGLQAAQPLPGPEEELPDAV